MKAVVSDDLVSGVLSGDAEGVPIPAALRALPSTRLRFVQGTIVDAATLQTFHIDAAGVKHAVAGTGRQPLACAWDAELVGTGSTWRVCTLSERLAPQIKSACARRIFAVASANTQMNLTAAQAAGRLSAADSAVYIAGLGWIDTMRRTCAELIAAADDGYSADTKWPAVPSGLADLCARF